MLYWSKAQAALESVHDAKPECRCIWMEGQRVQETDAPKETDAQEVTCAVLECPAVCAVA